MTTRRKWACLAAAGIAATLLIAFFLTRRSDRREPEVASPSDSQSSQLQASKTPHTPRTIPPEAEAGDGRSGSELIDVTTGSISGRLVDAGGNVNIAEGRTFRYAVAGQGLIKYFDIRPDGTYLVDGLPDGLYSIMFSDLDGKPELCIRGQYYFHYEIPQGISPGSTDADIVLMSANPGVIRGRVLHADTTVPVTSFTVYQKFDFESAPDRSRMCPFYLRMTDGGDTVPRGAFDNDSRVDRYRQEADRWKAELESLEGGEKKGDIDYARSQLEFWRATLERHRLDVRSPEGVFEQTGCMLGRYILTTLAEGFLSESVEVEVKDSKPAEVTFLMRQQGSAVLGRVEDSSGVPMEGALVEILTPTNSQYFYSWLADPKWRRIEFVTSESGEFVFENLAGGTYELRVSGADYATMAVSYVRLSGGRQEPSDLVLKMDRGDASVWGRITREDTSAFAGATFDVSSNVCSVKGTTDSDGHYLVMGLPPGRYGMRIAEKYLADKEYIFSLAPSQKLRYDIAMDQSAALIGSIRVDHRWTRLAHSLRLVLRSESVTVAKQLHLQPLECYRFYRLPPGKYELEVLSDALGNVRYDVSLAPNEKKTLDVNLGQRGNLSGRVIGREGSPLPGLGIKVLSPGGQSTTETDDRGRYSVSNLPPGHIQIIIPGGKFAGSWFEIQLRAHLFSPGTPEGALFDIDFVPLGDVSGQILNSDGEPSGISALRIESPHRSVEVVTNRGGRFRAEGLFPGQCRIHLPQPMSGRAYAFDLAPKEKKELKIVLPP